MYKYCLFAIIIYCLFFSGEGPPELILVVFIILCVLIVAAIMYFIWRHKVLADRRDIESNLSIATSPRLLESRKSGDTVITDLDDTSQKSLIIQNNTYRDSVLLGESDNNHEDQCNSVTPDIIITDSAGCSSAADSGYSNMNQKTERSNSRTPIYKKGKGKSSTSEQHTDDSTMDIDTDCEQKQDICKTDYDYV